MKGLYQKVVAGRYDPIGSQYSEDLKDMLRKTLQVKPADRANCDKILATPGLMNHITGALDEIKSPQEETESLLSTIKVPRQLGMIGKVMPASQYGAVPIRESRDMKKVLQKSTEIAAEKTKVEPAGVPTSQKET